MRLRILYASPVADGADLLAWEGEAAGCYRSDDSGVLRVSAEHPEPGKWVHFSGWDHYGVTVEPCSVLIGVWKTDDLTDPFYGQGMVWTFGADGRQKRTRYLPLAEIPVFAVVRRGQWVSAAVARSAGLL